MPVRRKQIRETVEALLAKHQITDGPVPVEKIALNMGIEVSIDPVEDNLSGFLYRDKEAGRTVIGANKSHSPNRVRFTIAHELGHYLLHEGEVIHLDEEPASFTMDFRDGRSAKGEDDNEKEANLFAAELLMPAHFLKRELAGQRIDMLDDSKILKQLADKYKVSQQALTFRLTNLDYITP